MSCPRWRSCDPSLGLGHCVCPWNEFSFLPVRTLSHNLYKAKGSFLWNSGNCLPLVYSYAFALPTNIHFFIWLNLSGQWSYLLTFTISTNYFLCFVCHWNVWWWSFLMLYLLQRRNCFLGRHGWTKVHIWKAQEIVRDLWGLFQTVEVSGGKSNERNAFGKVSQLSFTFYDVAREHSTNQVRFSTNRLTIWELI